MKTQQEFKLEINRKINEVNAKIADVRKRYASTESSEVQNELLSILNHLESTRNNLILQYERIDKLGSTEKEFSELEKDIYTNLETFDSAFSKAGTIVKSRKFGTREHSTDFNNPLGNK